MLGTLLRMTNDKKQTKNLWIPALKISIHLLASASVFFSLIPVYDLQGFFIFLLHIFLFFFFSWMFPLNTGEEKQKQAKKVK